MKIGMMADMYTPHISGVTNYIILSKRHLEENGHEVFVFTFGNQDQEEEPNVIRSPGIPVAETGFFLGLGYNQTARDLLTTMDITHVHHPFLSGTLARRYCASLDIPIIFTNHTRYDLYANAYIPILPDVAGETLMKTYMPAFCRACDLVIAPSPGLAQILIDYGVDQQIEVVPNGVDLTPFRVVNKPIERADFGLSSEEIILMYFGRLGPEKNLRFLLQSFAGTVEACKNVHLFIVGGGSELNKLKEYTQHLNLSNHVHFTGFIPYELLPKYVAMADAFVTASVTEVHPLSLIEAMAAGLPVLGIASPGVGDTIEDEVTGYLSSEDIAAYTAKMVKLVIEDNKRKEMGRQAQIASEKYAVERTTKIMIQHYQNLLNRPEQN
jgi:glycosyltransferase involved in cell wall biosynthesis